MRELKINNLTKNTTVGTRITLADTHVSRLVGLLGRAGLDAGCGLLITPSSGIHTFFMKFRIDVIALDKNMKVLRVWRRLGPWRMTSVNRKTVFVLELPTGQIDSCCIEPGDVLDFG